LSRISRAGSLTISKSVFSHFIHVAFDLSLSLWVLFVDTKFQTFTTTESHSHSAIQVSGAAEFRLDSIEFDTFTNFAPLDSGQPQTQPRTMFTLFNVNCRNINISVSEFGLFNCGFEYFYSETLTFTNCQCYGLFHMISNHLQMTPIFRNLMMNCVNFVESGNVIFGFDNLTFFVIEGGIFKNTKNFYSTGITIYIESVQFIEEDNEGRVGISPNGRLSIIGCSFKGLVKGVNSVGSSDQILICGCNFTNCVIGIYYTTPQCEVVNCVFEGYTNCGIDCVVGGSQSTKALTVQRCAFLDLF
jgi:hypothetical protein